MRVREAVSHLSCSTARRSFLSSCILLRAFVAHSRLRSSSGLWGTHCLRAPHGAHAEVRAPVSANGYQLAIDDSRIRKTVKRFGYLGKLIADTVVDR
jgi:hypothetical protein